MQIIWECCLADGGVPSVAKYTVDRADFANMSVSTSLGSLMSS